ncbi:MAG: glycosyltransferase [Fimbriimonadia bacterium]|nr:glycosyltransferase [Fimbriimonadia bacterium]
MRVLFITASNPYPPVSGGQRRGLDELRVYSQFAQVDLLTFYDQTETEVPHRLKEHLKSICRKIECVPMPLKFNRHRSKQLLQFARAMMTPYPFRVQKFWQPAMIELYQRWLGENEYDVLHYNHLATTRYWELARDHSAIKVCTEANVEWEIFARYAESSSSRLQRWAAARETQRLRQFETNILNRMDGVIALSERDREILQSDGVKTPIHIFRRPMEVAEPPVTTFAQADPTVISLGRLEETRTHGTLWFAEQVWDRVLAKVPNAQWRIIGADPPASIRALHGTRNIQVEGFLEDLTPALQKSRACIIPLLIGGGIRIKILDMLSVGMPCVSTQIGAQGLENDGVWVADEPEAFAKGVAKVLTDEAHWTHMQRAGQQFIRDHYSPEIVSKEPKQFLESLQARKAALLSK